jgi:acyl-homoserine-lactone acylase
MSRRTLALALLAACTAPALQAQVPARLAREARNVTIVRDDWGIAHVHGRTDADAVFGMEYAQAEDDFNRVETNYITALGWTAQVEGEPALWTDLRQRLWVDEAQLRREYAASPAWLRRLMDAFADGLNYYLATHPQVHPKLIRHFEPWMALSFTEGSIGGDIERVDVRALAAFYGAAARDVPARSGDGLPGEPTGSNGIAIAPSHTRDHHALLWINPHTSFYFRSELQMASDEGLDAYGAVTWGQFFIYQGFNPTAGWMHTSSGVDNIDQFLETVRQRNGWWEALHGGTWTPVRTRRIALRYRTAAGRMATRVVTAYFTRHGPVVAKDGDKWVSTSLMQDHIHALIQSYTRTKAKDLAAFEKIMALHTNSSNNTIFADAEGHIAYFHSNYIPRRDTSFDRTRPVDGSDPRTDYHGVLAVDESPNVIDPASGFVYNSNNWPWSAAGPDSPRRDAYPRYVETGTEESPRGEHVLRLLPGRTDFTRSSLIAAAFDSYQPAFARMIPVLIAAWDSLPAADPRRATLAEPIGELKGWDFRWDSTSVATSLAVFWGTYLEGRTWRDAVATGMNPERYVAERVPAGQLLEALDTAVARLTADFGDWRTPWGAINRFQRINDDIAPHFDDAAPSIAVPFTSARWGSLASFGAQPYPNTKKWYGTSGNSFVAVVEFGDSVRARAVTAGGESGDPRSPHFADEAARYATGDLRDVYFYPGQLAGHTERTYHPGDR